MDEMMYTTHDLNHCAICQRRAHVPCGPCVAQTASLIITEAIHNCSRDIVCHAVGAQSHGTKFVDRLYDAEAINTHLVAANFWLSQITHSQTSAPPPNDDAINAAYEAVVAHEHNLEIKIIAANIDKKNKPVQTLDAAEKRAELCSQHAMAQSVINWLDIVRKTHGACQ